MVFTELQISCVVVKLFLIPLSEQNTKYNTSSLHIVWIRLMEVEILVGIGYGKREVWSEQVWTN